MTGYPNHLARFISETVDQMDLSSLITVYRGNGQGNAAYHPAMMVKVLLYACEPESLRILMPFVHILGQVIQP